MMRLFFLTFFISLLATAELASACPDRSGLLDLNCDGEVNIIAFGDSITFGIGDDELRGGYPGRLAEMFPEAIIHNYGDPGENTTRGRMRAPSAFAEVGNADFIIVLEGVNDYFDPLRESEDTRARLLSMIQSAENTGAFAVLMNLTEVRRSFQKDWVRSVNAQIRPYKDIDLFSLGDDIISGDLLHPHGPGYSEMVGLIGPYLRALSDANRPIDSDGDGIYDWAESKFGANPLVADTDGDGLGDGLEVFTYHSNPNRLDSDGDGLTDPYEVNVLHSNPADARPGAPTIRTIKIVSGPR